MESIVRIQISIRKTLTEFTAVLLEWESTQSTCTKILASLVNASLRRKDYVQSVGKLGVLTSFESAEHLVQVWSLACLHACTYYALKPSCPFSQLRLLQSLDKLLAALHFSVKAFHPLVDRMEKTCTSFSKEFAELSADCNSQDLWLPVLSGRVSASESMEWIQDLTCSAQKQLELMQTLASEADYENLDEVCDLWNAEPFLSCSRNRERIEHIKLMAVAENK
jgi:hypothetical protein